MEKEFEKSIFYKSFMTCVFVGLMGTVLCMLYDLFFTEVLHFPLSAIVNVATLIFAINIVFLVIGTLFYGFIKVSKSGETFFTVLFVLITGFFLWKIQGVQRTDNSAINTQFRYLSSGIVLILGLLTAVGIPYLFHNKKFETYIL
ncbi:MAG: hypothetical protein ABIU63_16065 [Chitinophagaceae bacterium]